MDQNIVRILIISTVIILIKMIIVNIKKIRKYNVPKLEQEQLEYNDILDDVIDLCIEYFNNKEEKYTEQQLIVISTMEYHNEVMNGGLCQFFSNSSRFLAPILSKSLEQVGANKHKVHFDKFIKQNSIDVNDLNSFESEDVDTFINQYNRYPFDDFDSKFYDIDIEEDLGNLIIEYTRNNFNKVFVNSKK